jgi:hypothetical protein
MSKPMHNPGSAEAIGRGCICDFIKNDFGRGKADPDGVAFYCSEACPVHGVLMAFADPQTQISAKSDEANVALKWLKSRALRPFRRRS